MYSRLRGDILKNSCVKICKFHSGSDYDIIVVGGGMVGSAMACALANEPVMAQKRILLLESRKHKQFELNETYSNRVSAISPSSAKLLKESGVWEHIPRYAPVNRMQVWDGCSDAMIAFDKVNEGSISYIVENNVLLQSMMKKLTENPGPVTVAYEEKIVNYQLPTDPMHYVVLTTKDGKQLRTRLLIGADGFNSRIRSAMGVQVLNWNYDQRSIVATCKLHEPLEENSIALQKFHPKGPIALLPLTNELSSLVWSTTKKEAQNLMSLSEDEFTDSLNAALWMEHGANSWSRKAVQQVQDKIYEAFPSAAPVRQLPPSIQSIDPGSRASFPLGMIHSTCYVSPRVALIGDAAHRIHPLAGLGANLGFGDVTSLHNILRDAVKNGRELGSSYHLQEYETERLRKNVPVMAGIEAIFRIETNESQPLCFLRSVGLILCNTISPVKNFLTKMAID